MNATAHLSDDILNAWIDDVATPDERAIVQDHVATCEVCQQRLDELRAVKAMLSTLSPVAPRRSFQLTPEQAGITAPTPIRRDDKATGILRFLPVVRALSVAAILAVMILGGTLALGPADSDSETDGAATSFMVQEPAPQAAPGEVVDQGEAASAHDSTMDSLSNEGQGAATSSRSAEEGLSMLEISTIVAAGAAVVLTTIWIGMSASRRSGIRP